MREDLHISMTVNIEVRLNGRQPACMVGSAGWLRASKVWGLLAEAWAETELPQAFLIAGPECSLTDVLLVHELVACGHVV